MKIFSELYKKYQLLGMKLYFKTHPDVDLISYQNLNYGDIRKEQHDFFVCSKEEINNTNLDYLSKQIAIQLSKKGIGINHITMKIHGISPKTKFFNQREFKESGNTIGIGYSGNHESYIININIFGNREYAEGLMKIHSQSTESKSSSKVDRSESSISSVRSSKSSI